MKNVDLLYHYILKNIYVKNRNAFMNVCSLDRISKLDKIRDRSFGRLLAKHEFKKNLDNSILREKLPDYRNYKGKKNEEVTPKYGDLKGSGFNDLDVYRKGYKRRYTKKKGLAKLYCYYENKIFNKIDYINNIAQNVQNNKISFIKSILNKYTIRFLLLAILPFVGVIIPQLFGGKERVLPVFWGTDCDHQKDNATNKCKNFYHIPDEASYAIGCLNWIISYTLLMIVIFVVIYTFIKLIKYEKLKSGKGKMGVKAYCRFAKDVFI
ncbi:hypothetical protein PVBG_05472 [Plasmodium vivax Brazil I]|uniref:Variable surface protein Vir35 n=1 Tax=Plasmodium vivax (strain Brazil I) TaxID=1033975 RepID=A0A0J9VHB9_PLAV1|nr:hypothetical protein PVBG_05472 [Plasmodium vivax Brazil I]